MKPKIPTITVKSDECAISLNQVIEDGEIVDEGQKYFIHTDEWVEIMPVMSVREVMQLSRLQQGSGANSVALGDNLSELCKELSKRVIKWNWTNLLGEKLSQPYNDPSVLHELSSDELLWLVNATSQSEKPAERKKDSEGSVNTS